jgi:hypothetical protein
MRVVTGQSVESAKIFMQVIIPIANKKSAERGESRTIRSNRVKKERGATGAESHLSLCSGLEQTSHCDRICGRIEGERDETE